ncbi:MAG: polysaccharide deacetylase family protein [Candidatus Eremiobacter antarcticus]|nr:polysaccharide deacetylase family protein [Candidatus Eremiobacteraeota bacterium]MBC5809154.1 polysaccharide deacetylase family protein [Candidatus Eremiobacteraeota bacterium]
MSRRAFASPADREELRKKRLRLAVIAVIGAAVIFTALWYTLENPFSQTFGTTVTQVPLQQKVVALTFDDGPNPPYTDRIVEYLHSQHVVATFFVVGMAVAAHPDIVRKEVAYDDALGNHTWDHAHLVLERSAHIEREIAQTDAIIFRTTGVHSRIFRPPFGARDFAVLKVAHRMGYTVVMWSVPLPGDWKHPAPALISRRVLKYVSDGSIIVLHDGNRGRGGNRESTVAATQLIVTALKHDGYRFVTVPELLAMGYGKGKRQPLGEPYE